MVEIRLFIAIELPDPARIALKNLQADLAILDRDRSIRWTAPESIHLTLKFLGETTAEKIDPITMALHRACKGHSSFDLSIESVGGFPNTHQPRIVWAGLVGDLAALIGLREAIEANVAPLGYPTDKRPFAPHLTIGRTKQIAPTAIRAFGRQLESAKAKIRTSWRAEEVCLMCSELKSDGAVYSRLATMGLSPEKNILG